MSAFHALDAVSSPVWLPASEGWTGFVKPFWFGANANGPSSEATLKVMSKHAVSGYGWQQGGQGHFFCHSPADTTMRATSHVSV